MPNTDYLRYLEELRQIPTLSGFENAGQKEVQQLLAPLFDESRPAGVSGLLFTKKCGRENAPVLLIDAHLDEIGLIVTDLKDDGTLTVSSGEEILAELPLLAGEEVPRISFRQMLGRMLKIACLAG